MTPPPNPAHSLPMLLETSNPPQGSETTKQSSAVLGVARGSQEIALDLVVFCC